MESIKLSVLIQCYQQADTIQQAVESALSQQTDFRFEVIVGDDASSDGTCGLLRKIERESGGQVIPIIAETNPGDFGFTNMATTLCAARGEYVAFLDGDDFWTASDKLQKQVDFLDSRPDCNLCAHRVVHRRPDGSQFLSPVPPDGSGPHDVGKLIVDNFVPRISTVLRKSAALNVPDWYWTSYPISADWVMNVLASRTGGVGFIDEPMAVRNIHNASVSAYYGPRRMFNDKLRMLEMMASALPNHRRAINQSKNRVRMKLLISRFPWLFGFVKRANNVVTGRRVTTTGSI
ncbi:MAG: glycosyltransferase [Pseudomonadota bacterium]